MTEIINASNIFSADSAAKTAALYEAKKVAILAVRERVNDTMNSVVAALNENPDAGILLSDIADKSGVNRSAIRHWYERQGYQRGLTKVRVYRCRKFAEVDEDGKLVPNGKTYEQVSRCTGYQKRNNCW